MSRTKSNAHAALYDTESIQTIDPQKDANGLLRLQSEPEWREPSPTVHPMLISAGQKNRMSVDSSLEHGQMFLNCYLDNMIDQATEPQAMRVVGLMAKQGDSSFMRRPSRYPLGASVNVSTDTFKDLLNQEMKKHPSVQLNLLQLNSMYEFEDQLPKTSLQIKYREGLDRTTAEEIKYGLLHFITDFSLAVSEKYSLEDFFAKMVQPQQGYIGFITIMMLVLGFFMTSVSYS